MFGEPNDVEGQCNARLHIADNYGDNHATLRCQLEPDHTDRHQESYNAGPGNHVVVTWDLDARDEPPEEP